MNYKLFLFFALTLFSISSCTIDDTEPATPNIEIDGTYIMQTYETHSGESTPSENDKVIVTSEDETTATVAIDYSTTGSGNDVTLNDMPVTASGSKFQMDKTFSNAEAYVEIEENEVYIHLEYTNGNWAIITGVK